MAFHPTALAGQQVPAQTFIPGLQNQLPPSPFTTPGQLRQQQTQQQAQQQAGLAGAQDPAISALFSAGQQTAATGAQDPAISQIFQSELGRNPDAPGLAFYQQQLAQGVPLEQVRAQINASAEGMNFDQTGVAQQSTGLRGAEEALQATLTGSLGQLGVGRQDILGQQQLAQQQLGQARGDITGFTTGGAGAQQQQAALSGALGPQAQQAAFDAFTESPGQAFLRERGERALTRNAAALGGLGGGNVRAELQRQGIGFAQQDLERQFQALGAVANRGLSAGGILAGLGTTGAGLATQVGGQLGQLGVGGANIFQNIGQQSAIQRLQTGQLLAQNIGGTTSALANLAATQGGGLADIAGAGGANIAAILQNAGLSQAQIAAALGGQLSNVATGSASTIAGLPQVTPTNTAALLAQAAGGIAGAFGSLPTTETTPAQNIFSPVTTTTQLTGTQGQAVA